MEQNISLNTCPNCHQAVLPTYYFCPNCGEKLNQAPLKTDTWTQVWIYAFSIVLPMIVFLFVNKWPGVKYFKSKDQKAKKIGQIAWVLIISSTIITAWLAYVITTSFVQSQLNSLNLDLGS